MGGSESKPEPQPIDNKGVLNGNEIKNEISLVNKNIIGEEYLLVVLILISLATLALKIVSHYRKRIEKSYELRRRINTLTPAQQQI